MRSRASGPVVPNRIVDRRAGVELGGYGLSDVVEGCCALIERVAALDVHRKLARAKRVGESPQVSEALEALATTHTQGKIALQVD